VQREPLEARLARGNPFYLQMVNSLPGDETQITLWLIAFALSLGCLLAVGFESYFGSSRRSLVVRNLARFGLVLLGLLALADVLARIPVLDGLELIARAVVLAMGALGFGLLIPWRGLAQDASRRVPWNLVLLSVVGVVFASSRFYAVSAGETEDLADMDVRSPDQCLTVVPHSLAYTDRGRAVSLYQYNEPAEGADPKLDGRIPDVFDSKLILAKEPDPRTNCHGWVFAGGEFVIRGAAVDNILSDNGYEQVEEPLVGDVIVHRDAQGIPIHSGIVKATGNDGFVLIESKWGSLARYLHEPKTQCYGQDFAYFRSTRPGHRLRIEESFELEYPGVYPVEPARPAVLAKTRHGNADPKVLGAE